MQKIYLTNTNPEKVIQINPEIAELYIEWGVFERDPSTDTLTHVVPASTGGVTISVEKQICFEETAWEPLEGSPFTTTESTKIPSTRIVGGKYKFTSSGLSANRELIVCVYPRY
ncbi:hypothetical protein Kuja_0910 [Vibrio phage vB_VchM_Kuja]|uniref:Uncharacterized protein n=1 Tax=Vibrio phage vB_VchM_Kuja TaxID=2686437 RepID=A0A6B9JBX5_9CAUD|nr:hypothetical protein HWC83_gp145 [Vibrio phage vB_VchM_Kuja]QGZ16082.1 hypothetical protein Kuja_0910 [Vibrio phage vB_VchM_Kuja]